MFLSFFVNGIVTIIIIVIINYICIMFESIESYAVSYFDAHPIIWMVVSVTIIIFFVILVWIEGWEELFKNLFSGVLFFTCIALIIVFYRWLIHQFT